MRSITLILTLWLAIQAAAMNGQNRIPVTIDQPGSGAPITMGVPFPIGALQSPDNVRVLNGRGEELPSQITEVSTWQPRDNSIKWIWVFFFSESSADYIIEYGPQVVRTPYEGPRLVVMNNQRSRGYAEIDTGPLKLRINTKKGGFISNVYLDTDKNGFDDNDLIAVGDTIRGSFLDILDDAGIDRSNAIIKKTVREKGSGPLHSIIRIEGEYQYSRDDNNPSPFITRIHAYAGKTYIKVLHTIIYTGKPDMHKPRDGEHPNIATQNKNLITTHATDDPGWTQPNDRIASAGFKLQYRLEGTNLITAGYDNGDWWNSGNSQIFETDSESSKNFSVIQSGPDNSTFPASISSNDTRIHDFNAQILCNSDTKIKSERAEGWIDISDKKWGVATGIRNFVEEYPKGFDAMDNEVSVYLWPPGEQPMSFARWSDKPDGQMLDNFAQGLAKTSEITYNFHTAQTDTEQVRRELNYFLNPPAGHTDPQWYADSEVYGKFSPRGNTFEEFERGLEYKYDWVLFNQNWSPWYGMFDYGDFKTYYYNQEWHIWSNNEPAQDFMLWMHFIRTGDQKYFLAADASSRHTMDVDNIHWPTFPEYNAGRNDAVEYWNFQDQQGGTPYLGIGRRHAHQHWIALLSAHVWIQGWIASYYLNGYHRGLEVAKLAGDAYIRRPWGEHGLTGRRLYLSVWNLVELYDATKDERYKKELDERVDRMLKLQQGPDQYNSLIMDRYGYSQVYASQGLSKYYQITGNEEVKNSLIRHARAVRDNPPWNHKYESYLSTIHSLLIGYEYTGESSFLREALKRSEVLKTDRLPGRFNDFETQKELEVALQEVSHLPDDPVNRDVRGDANWSITQGLRVFGWTHAYNVPALLYWLRRGESNKK